MNIYPEDDLKNSKRYQRLFWEWFDNLDKKVKSKYFENGPMADMYFYNQIWKKVVDKHL
jgi:hypothetical protein